jgi:hypothetical protein
VREFVLLPVSAVAGGAALGVGVLAVALLVLMPATRTSGALGAIVLLTLYSVAIAVNLGRDRRSIDCGCGALGARQPISEWLLVRNAVLGLAAWTMVYPTATRPLVWMDWLTIVGAIAVLGCAWTAAHGLWATRALSATRAHAAAAVSRPELAR